MSNKKAATRGRTSTATATFDTADRPEKIRNVALVGHSGAGKTTLAEALLAATGTIPRAGSIVEGTTVSDHDPVEIAQQRSVALAVCPLQWDGVMINLLDTPGYPDFTGELRAGLRAADGALFVVSAADDIDPITVALWEECAALGTPRAVVITKLDAPRADYDAAVAACQRVFGGADGQAVLPLYVPVDDRTLIGLLSRSRVSYADGFPPTESAAGDDDIDEPRGALIEAIINNSEDETLLERYISGEEIGLEVLVDDLETAVARGTFFPVLPVCSESGLGLAELLEVLTGAFPSPVELDLPETLGLYGNGEKALECRADGPLLAEVVRTTVDPYLGRLSVLRLFSGTLTPETAIHVSGHGGAERGHPDHDADERVAQIFSPLGATLRPIERAVAGDICAVGRLGVAETGDTISAKSAPLLMAPWEMPEPLLPIAVEAATRGDEDALAKALARLTAGDPTVRIERHADTGQLVLWCLGEAHADVVLDRLRATGAHVETVPLRIAVQETFTRESRGHGRLVKQSGGHGQYAVCDVVVTPLPRGSGVQFAEKVVGGAVPSQFISSVEKGVRTQLELGVTQDHTPVVDVLVTLTDGKSHSVDSSDAAFQTAGALAVKDAAANGDLCLLEPLAAVDITVPDAHVGAVLSDLSGRRGRVTGTEPDTTAMIGMERSIVHAEIPDAELVRYATTLRSLTAGTGRFTRRFARYDLVPPNVAGSLREALAG
ncbi:MAG TPA: elongation factor G-like protein EF-G2 [Jatrophihabitans sp.]|uniref:elongation factor G-like protein EF-G2 n=1 Tax=Jatrophihabitans sp. TaxID=1932789 RepID=UPI002DFA013B|nr:elongation factor G-like protein EF-G2 [Jatrophihabitans sp.]